MSIHCYSFITSIKFQRITKFNERFNSSDEISITKVNKYENFNRDVVAICILCL